MKTKLYIILLAGLLCVFTVILGTEYNELKACCFFPGEESFSVNLVPNSASKGSKDVTLCFEITNNHLLAIYYVKIQAPNSSFDYDSAWGGYNGEWVAIAPPRRGNNPVYFFPFPDTLDKLIPPGGTGKFYIKFSSLPETIDCYNFVVTANLFPPDKILNFCIVDFARTISLAANPRTGIIANGISTSILTAKVTKTTQAGQTPEANVSINFTASTGTLLSQTAATSQDGICQVTLRSPHSANDINSNITASDGTATANTIINFRGTANSGTGNSIIDFREVPIEDDTN